MYSEKTNNHCALLSNLFDYRYDKLAIHVGYELQHLQRIVVAHGVSFEEFLDDVITALRHKATSTQELMLLKLDVVYGDYFPRPLSETMYPMVSALFDTVTDKIKSTIAATHLYHAGRFDYGIAKHSNHGLLFTKN